MEASQVIKFDEWVRQIFDHPVTDPEWFFQRKYDTTPPILPPAVDTEYMARLFEDPGLLTNRYSEGQIAHGLQYLLHTSEYMFVLLDQSVSEQLRIRLVDSFFPLFQNLLAGICSDSCGGPEDSSKRPADYVCFMMWDAGVLKLCPDRPAQRPIDMAMLDVLRRILALPQKACQKSALHGLNHAYFDYPDQATEIVDDFLRENPSIPEDLREYALAAREGGVL